MDALTRRSPAKINLTLRVGGRRPDGFHEIESLIAQIDLCDTVTVSPRDDGQWSIECDDPAIPRDGSNLALRAGHALAEAAGIRRGAHVSLAKRIPAGAGLGGGSSNAATTLDLLNELWRLGMTRADLARIGAGLGSDVPLFFHSPLCIVRGRGEEVEDIAAQLHAWVALILPGLQCSTPAVYAAFDRLTLHQPRPGAPDKTPLALREGAGGGSSLARMAPSAVMRQLFNDLEAAAFDVTPALRQLVERVTGVGLGPIRMTGSGSTLFRLFENESSATHFASHVAATFGVRTAVARLCSR